MIACYSAISFSVHLLNCKHINNSHLDVQQNTEERLSETQKLN
jgi:hypothetical protein